MVPAAAALLALASAVLAGPFLIDTNDEVDICGEKLSLQNGQLLASATTYANFVSNELTLNINTPGQGKFALKNKDIVYTDASGNLHTQYYFCDVGSSTTPVYLSAPQGKSCYLAALAISPSDKYQQTTSILQCPYNPSGPVYGSRSRSRRSTDQSRLPRAMRAHETEYKLVVGTMFRDKAQYLKEWIEFHLMMGVERFLLYDNESVDSPLSVLRPYIASGHVVYQSWPPKSDSILPAPAAMDPRDAATQEDMYEKALKSCNVHEWTVHKPVACQVAASIDMLRRTSGRADWLGFWDVDEFIYPTQDSRYDDLAAFLAIKSFKRVDQVVLHGSTFGTNEGQSGNDSRISPLVSERYIHRRALSDDRPSPFTSATEKFLTEAAVGGVLAQTFTLPETMARKAIVQPSLAIWSSVHEWVPLPSIAETWLSHTIELGDARIKMNHYAYLSREEANEKALVNGNPLAAYNEEQDAFYRAEEDYEIQWLVRALRSRLGLV